MNLLLKKALTTSLLIQSALAIEPIDMAKPNAIQFGLAKALGKNPKLECINPGSNQLVFEILADNTDFKTKDGKTLYPAFLALKQNIITEHNEPGNYCENGSYYIINEENIWPQNVDEALSYYRMFFAKFAMSEAISTKITDDQNIGVKIEFTFDQKREKLKNDEYKISKLCMTVKYLPSMKE